MTSFGTVKANNLQKFSLQKSYSSPIRKSFTVYLHSAINTVLCTDTILTMKWLLDKTVMILLLNFSNKLASPDSK